MLINFIYKYFQLKKNNSTIKQELYGGFITFLTMSYIVFVNPNILASAGMDKEALFTATILASVFAMLLMGFYANSPFALAPGMGLNAFFAYGIVLGMGFTWQIALGAVFLSGILMIIFTILPIRKYMINILPNNLKIAISAGIGLFLMVIGLKNAEILVANEITLGSLGDLTSPAVLISIIGFFIIITLDLLKIQGAILISIAITAILSLILGLSTFTGVISAPPSIEPIFFKLDIANALQLGIATIILSLFLVDFFDSTGTFIALNRENKQEQTTKKTSKALLVDGISTVAGSTMGVSTVTSYVESASGVAAGARTGLSSIFIAFFMLLMLVFSPLLNIIGAASTSPVLIFIAYLMFKNIKDLEWENNPEEILAVFLTIIMMPLTFSIFNGIGIGIIAFLLGKLFSKKWNNSYYFLVLIALCFIASIII